MITPGIYHNDILPDDVMIPILYRSECYRYYHYYALEVCMYMYILSLRPRDGYPLELRVLEDMDPWICMACSTPGISHDAILHGDAMMTILYR